MASVFVARLSRLSVFACKLLALQFAALVKILADAAKPKLFLVIRWESPRPPWPPPRSSCPTCPRSDEEFEHDLMRLTRILWWNFWSGVTAATAAGTSSLHDSTSEVTKTAFFFDLLNVTLRRLESLFSDFPRSTFKKVNMIIFFSFSLSFFFSFWKCALSSILPVCWRICKTVVTQEDYYPHHQEIWKKGKICYLVSNLLIPPAAMIKGD